MSNVGILYLLGMSISGAWFIISGQRAGLRIRGHEGFSVFAWPLTVPLHAWRLWNKRVIDRDCAEDPWMAQVYGLMIADLYQPARPRFPLSNEQADDWVKRATTP